MQYCYNGKLIEIDLTLQQYKDILLEPDIIKTHFLGSGYGIYYFLKNVNLNVNPLSTESVILIITGLLTGTAVPTACKLSICGISPLTKIWNESTVGGHFGNMLKCSGYDGIIIKGKSHIPLYIYINDGHVEFKDASHLIGLDTIKTDEIIRSETNEYAKVMCIGISGEKQVNISSLVCEGKNARVAGRGGMGAIFGFKNLKAIAVFGTKKVQVANYDLMINELKIETPLIKEKTSRLFEFGTVGGLNNAYQFGGLPIKNWQSGYFNISSNFGEEFVKITNAKNYYCHSCMIGCGKIMNFFNEKYGNFNSHMPEYEGAAAFSSLVLNNDPYIVCYACKLCDEFGLDTISTGSVIAFAMECYEHGLITKNDAYGLDLSWGSAEAIIELIKHIGLRTKGLGETLGLGVKLASEKIGGISTEFAVHVKGLEVAMHDPRAFYAMAANYMTANRGACHLESLAYTLGYGRNYKNIGLPDQITNDSETAALLCILTQNFFGLFNPLGICKFIARASFSIDEIRKWIEIVFGFSYTNEELFLISERIFNEKRILNVKLGITRKDDILPLRLFTKKREGTNRAAQNLPDIGVILNKYYELRGWNELGIPTPQKLSQLKIEFTV